MPQYINLQALTMILFIYKLLFLELLDLSSDMA